MDHDYESSRTGCQPDRWRQVYHWLRCWPDWLFPARCRLCGDPADSTPGLCRPCHAELPWLGPHCRQCALPLATDRQDLLCGRCRLRPPAFDHTRAALHYLPPVDYLVRRLKFGPELALARLLADLLLHAGPAGTVMPQVLVPVPLHPARLRARGFNQAAVIAGLLGRRLDLPVLHACRRLRDTPPQSSLPHIARRLNVRNAFALTRALPGTRIAIVDDVMTSGQTAHELARVLRAGGAETVEVWVIARAGTA